MAFPVRPATGVRSFRAFAEGTTTTDFADHAIDFAECAGANTLHHPVVARPDTRTVLGTTTTGSSTPQGARVTPIPSAANLSLPRAEQAPAAPAITCAQLRICNDGSPGDGRLEFSFDGTNIHGVVLPGEVATYRNRYEGGIAVRHSGGAAVPFRVEAW